VVVVAIAIGIARAVERLGWLWVNWGRGGLCLREDYTGSREPWEVEGRLGEREHEPWLRN